MLWLDTVRGTWIWSCIFTPGPFVIILPWVLFLAAVLRAVRAELSHFIIIWFSLSSSVSVLLFHSLSIFFSSTLWAGGNYTGKHLFWNSCWGQGHTHYFRHTDTDAFLTLSTQYFKSLWPEWKQKQTSKQKTKLLNFSYLSYLGLFSVICTIWQRKYSLAYTTVSFLFYLNIFLIVDSFNIFF